MAAPPCSLASLTVSTPEFEGLLLACSVLVQNGSCGISMKKAGNKWIPPKEVVYPANIQKGTGEGSYSFLIPFDSIVPEVSRRRSSNALKKTRSRAMSSE